MSHCICFMKTVSVPFFFWVHMKFDSGFHQISQVYICMKMSRLVHRSTAGQIFRCCDPALSRLINLKHLQKVFNAFCLPFLQVIVVSIHCQPDQYILSTYEIVRVNTQWTVVNINIHVFSSNSEWIHTIQSIYYWYWREALFPFCWRKVL